MFSVWTLAAVVVGYLSILFVLAFWGERRLSDNLQHPLIFSLAMGVHCTSWAFFGTTTQASQYGWAFIPTYLGIILVMVFGFGLVKKVSRLCHQHNISSLADFIGLQYQKSHLLAALVSILCFFGVVPYIALQLDALTKGFELLTHSTDTAYGSPGLYVTGLMALFAILFGTRSIGLTDKRPGLMLTIAFESVIKLAALLAVGLFICYGLFDGPFDLFGQAQNHPRGREIIYADAAPWVYVSHIALGVCAMFCLPRQFHINFVENNGEQELNAARWQFPLYLMLMSLFVLPTALAGHILFADGSVATDTYALALPVLADNEVMALTAFVGGISAATSMVIVATLAVGLMISNNLITPLWLKLQIQSGREGSLAPPVLLTIRRITVVLVLGVAYLYYLDISQGAPLVKSGIIAISLLSQTFPLILMGMLWSRRNSLAACAALVAGAMGWVYWLLWPSIKASYYFDPPPTDEALGLGFLCSIAVNVATFVVLSLVMSHKKHTEGVTVVSKTEALPERNIKLSSLIALTEKVFSSEQQQDFIESVKPLHENGFVNAALLNKIESKLASQMGGASARILLSAIAEKEHATLPELVEWVEEASQTFQFNHEVLQSSVAHIQQGICVLDRDLRLLAWNHRYTEMFDYPANAISVGMPIRDVLRFNAKRGLFGNAQDTEIEIDKRINYLLQGSQYKYVRKQPDGRVIELNGSPLPGGGFVTTYSDISEYIAIQQQLEEAKSTLEQRVEERTEQLIEANSLLETAKRQADTANESKTRFLAAAGHDLMQPFNAASLFASMLVQQADTPQLKELSTNLTQSLQNAEELLSMLLDMTKLESGVLTPCVQPFSLDSVLAPLVSSFDVMAQQKGLKLTYIPTSVCVVSDRKLLRRIVQNLLSNAIRYTQSGRVLLGVRRQQDKVRVCVTDSGPGIAKEDQSRIFEEFNQLGHENNKQGLGLGLTIVDRIASLLGHDVHLTSRLGKGTSFLIEVDKAAVPVPAVKPLSVTTHQDTLPLLQGKTVLAVDNEPHTLLAVSKLLQSWGATVLSANDVDEAVNHTHHPIDLMLLDYHLDRGQTGVDVANAVREACARNIPGVLNSANRDELIREEAADADLYFLPKPLKPAAFKRLVRQLAV